MGPKLCYGGGRINIFQKKRINNRDQEKNDLNCVFT